MQPRLLIVDDEPHMGRMLRTILGAHGYAIQIATEGLDAVEVAATWKPHVIILDLGLPGLDGFEVCRRIRRWSEVPIIVLTVRDADQAKVTALDLGADDYLTKPFSVNELLARIRVALRHAARRPNQPDPILTFDTLTIDRARRRVTNEGVEIHLTPTEYDLLLVLAGNDGKVLTHRMLIRAIWGDNTEHDLPALRVFINQLRRKIEPDPLNPTFIITEPGIGYRFRLAS